MGVALGRPGIYNFPRFVVPHFNYQTRKMGNGLDIPALAFDVFQELGGYHRQQGRAYWRRATDDEGTERRWATRWQ